MDQLSIDNEGFEKKIEKIEKVLSEENESFVNKKKGERIEEVCVRLSSIPYCEICDSC
jgi:hypothetical protein